MRSKQLGWVILVIGILAGLVVLKLISKTSTSAEDTGCYQDKECMQLAATLNISHLGIGIIFALLSLGFYLIFFSRSEEAILEKLEREKEYLLEEDKLKVIMMMLNKDEQKVFTAIREQDGITQSTLRFRADLSKSRISQILGDFEKKNLVRREPRGKTYAVHLVQSL